MTLLQWAFQHGDTFATIASLLVIFGCVKRWLTKELNLITKEMKVLNTKICEIEIRIQSIDQRLNAFDVRLAVIETRMGFVERLIEMMGYPIKPTVKEKDK